MKKLFITFKTVLLSLLLILLYTIIQNTLYLNKSRNRITKYNNHINSYYDTLKKIDSARVSDTIYFNFINQLNEKYNE